MLVKCVLIFIFINAKMFLVNPARILAIIPTPFYSHQLLFQPIWSALSRKHEITVLTTQPINDKNLPNLTEIDTSFLKENNVIIEEFLRGDQNILKTLFVFIRYYMKITDDLMELDIMRNITTGVESFDLVIYEQTFPIFAALCLKMNSACITVTPFELDDNLNPYLSLPPHSAISTNLVFPVYKNLSFFERCASEVFQKVTARFITWSFGIGFERRLRLIFGGDYSLEMAERNVDMVFVNTDPVFSVKKPMLPNTLEFDGTRLKKTEVLDDDLQLFLDSNTRGTILMSFGSAIKSRHLNEKFIRMVLEVFAELPYNIIWRSERNFLNATKNVKTMEWIPQNGILNHKNVILFINHAGLQSVSEALHTHTPLLVLPFCGDNARWARMVEQLQIGVRIDKQRLSKESFKSAILDVISNKKYKNKMLELSAISEDKQVDDLDNVIWWTEYVIRHKGAKHLRSEILDLPWYKYYCVDVYLFIFFIVYVLYWILTCFLKFVFKYRLILRTHGNKIKKS